MTTLNELKRFHWMLVQSQGGGRQKFREDCKNIDLSVDGVQESSKAKRTFRIVSVRFGLAIYVLRVFNPLQGIKHAKATREDILR